MTALILYTYKTPHAISLKLEKDTKKEEIHTTAYDGIWTNNKILVEKKHILLYHLFFII